MELTVIGLVLIPVGVGVALLSSPLPLLYLLIFSVPFTATALVNFSGPRYGLQPAYFLGMLLLLRVAWCLLKGRTLRVRLEQAGAVAPFAIFLAAAIASIVLIPFYDGGILVSRPSGATEALRITAENLTQLLYLVFVILLAVAIGTLGLSQDEIRRAIRVLLISGVFVCLWGWLQIGFYAAGLQYPASLFNNSFSFMQHYGQTVGAVGIKRMSSVLPEPSMLARFLLVPTFIAYYAMYAPEARLLRPRHAILLAGLFTLTLFATTASTAFLGFAVGVPMILLFFLASPAESWRKRHRLWRSAKYAALLVVCVPAALYVAGHVWLGLTAEQISAAFEILLLDKLSSTSGQTRVAGALHGLELFATHPLLGIGWGSNRTYDLTTNLLAGVGLVGTLAFAWAHAGLALNTYGARERLVSAGRRPVFMLAEALLVGLGAVLVGKAISEPDLVQLDHWVLVGLLVSLIATTDRRGRGPRRYVEGDTDARP